MNTHLQRLQQLLLAGLIALFSLTWPLSAHADAGAFLSSSSAAELQTRLEKTRDPERLADLQALQQALAASDDRAQLSNQTMHNLGLFARFKKDPPDAPAQFYVLGPGHETDDDYEVLGLLVPPQVALAWSGGGEIQSADDPRVLRVLETEQLTVSEPPDADSGEVNAVTYQLSLPAFSVESQLAAIPEVPPIDQTQLDQEPETAPLD